MSSNNGNDSNTDDSIMNDKAFETESNSNISESDASTVDLLQDVQIHHEETSGVGENESEEQNLDWLLKENESENTTVTTKENNTTEGSISEGTDNQNFDAQSEEITEEITEDGEVNEYEEEYSQPPVEKIVELIKENAFNIGMVVVGAFFVIVIGSQAIKVFGGGTTEVAAETADYMDNLDEPYQPIPQKKIVPAKKVASTNIEKDLNGISVNPSLAITPKRNIQPQPNIPVVNTPVSRVENSSNTITDGMLANKNTKAIMLLASKVQEYEQYNADIKQVMKIVTSEQRRLGEMVENQNTRIDNTILAINNLSEELKNVRTSNTAGNAFQAKQYTRSSSRPISRPGYKVVGSVPGIAYVRSRVKPNEIVKIVVGTNLIGYGKVTAINGYGDIMTIHGKVKRAQ